EIMDVADLAGVVEAHDVGMFEPGGGARLAPEALQGVGAVEAVGVDALDRDDAIEVPMTGFEDLAHASLADRFEQHAGAEDEVRSAFHQYLVSLVARQPVALDEPLGQDCRVRNGFRQATSQLLQLREFNKAKLTERSDQGADRGDGHDSDLTE